MEIKDMTMNDVNARMSEVKELLNTEGADVEALSAEVDELITRKQQIETEATAKRELREKVAGAVLPVIEKTEEKKKHDKRRNQKQRRVY